MEDESADIVLYIIDKHQTSIEALEAIIWMVKFFGMSRIDAVRAMKAMIEIAEFSLDIETDEVH
jgi:hypothetical protein